jgi:hypothetical protein
VEVLFQQFEIEPALTRDELRFAAWALRDNMERSDFGRVAQLIERYSGDLVKAHALINASFDYPEAVPIIVDWLENFDDRVPSGDARRYMRLILLRELDTKHAKGNRAAVPGAHWLCTGEIVRALGLPASGRFDPLRARLPHKV